jgi:dihydroorotate dehydrogenase (NAD+) catalytic subunit
LTSTGLGAFVEKTVTKLPAQRATRIPASSRPASGMLNSIGLEGYGLEGWIQKRYPRDQGLPLRPHHQRLRARPIEEYGRAGRRIDKLPRVDAFELNISCPNVSHGTDHAVDPASTERVCRLARRRPRGRSSRS